MSRARKLNIISDIVHFKRREYLTPNYVRVTLDGPGVQTFAHATNGVNNKILVPPLGVRDLHLPTPDPETGELVEAPEHLRPLRRTYTHRGVDLEKQELYIEFIAHQGGGPAAHWAEHAQVGDPIHVAMKGGAIDVVPPRDWYVLAGDATAIPVIRAVLESLPASAAGHALLEVESREHVQTLPTSSQLNVEWLIRDASEDSPIPARIAALRFPEEKSRFVYVAGEYHLVKATRSHLRHDRGLTPSDYWAYAYWKRGAEEHISEADRRAERAAGDAPLTKDAPSLEV